MTHFLRRNAPNRDRKEDEQQQLDAVETLDFAFLKPLVEFGSSELRLFLILNLDQAPTTSQLEL